MNVFAFSGLLIGIFCLLFGIFVYWKGRQIKSNKLWAIFCFSTAIWGFGGYKIGLIKDPSEALFWWRLTYIGIIFIPVLFYHFVYLFLGFKRKTLLYLFYFFSFFFLILEWTPWADLFFGLDNMGFLFNSFYWVFPTTPLFSFFVFSWFAIVVYSHYELYKAFKKSFGLKRTQIKYFFLGMAIAFAGGSTCFAPCFNIRLYPILNFTVPLYPAIVGYAILKYRLMDIRMAIKRSTIFSGIVIIITVVYVMAAFLLGWIFFGGVYTLRSQIITGLIVAILTAVGFRPLLEWLKSTTDAFLFKGDYRPQELMADVSDVLSKTLDLDKVINTLEGQITKALRLENMEVVVFEKEGLGKDNHKISLITKSSFTMTSRARKALNILVGYFRKQREILVLEELKRKHSEGILSDKNFLYIEEMEKLKSALVIPLVLKEKLLGLFLLEAKKSGDMFTNEDIKTLETIAAQASIAIENARLYEEMKDFSKTLQKEVEFQTKELRDANIRLQQLDKAKSEFISLASHQLRTPLSIIKGYISMMMEGSWGRINMEQKDQLGKVYLSNERLIKLVDDLLAVSRIESGRLEFDFKMVSLEKMVISVVEEFKKVVADKGLYLKYIEPKNKIPLLRIDALKIRQVVQNLVDNALHYTTEGGATIHLKSDQHKIVFSIKDTGIGVTDKEQVTLFEKFSRGETGSKIHTEGTGLGLYLAAKLVAAHQGRAWVESKGKGKGSTFYFELPIKRKK